MERQRVKRRMQQCVAAFLITAILIGALCGFIAVDLSTHRYMPGEFVPLFELSDISPAGMRLALLGREYTVDPSLLDPAKEFIMQYQGLLPSFVLLPAVIAVQGYRAAVDYIEQTKPVEEPW